MKPSGEAPQMTAEAASLYDAQWDWTASRTSSARPADRWNALVDMMLLEELFSTGRFDDPLHDHKAIPPSAWLHIDRGSDPFLSVVETVTGRLIFDVTVYRPFSRHQPSTMASFPTKAPVSPTSSMAPASESLAGASANVVDSNVGGERTRSLPGDLTAAAAWIVSQGRPFDPPELREAFAAFGLQLSDDGQAVSSASETLDGGDRKAGSGRRPKLALLLIRARLQAREALPRGRANVAVLARDELNWLRNHHPALEPPSFSSVERDVYRHLSGPSRIAQRTQKAVDK